MITEQEIREMLEAAKPSIIEGFKKEIKDSISYEVKKTAMDVVAAETEKWVKENIVPEIVKELVESKNGIISIGAKLAPLMVDAIIKSSIASLAKKMESGYERGKIFDSLFK